MAGDWIKMRCNLNDHPKVRKLARMVGQDIFGVVGRLHKIWSWADEHSEDGVVSTTFDDIDEVVLCENFASAMSEIGWLEEHGGNVVFVDFNTHNGDSAKKRANSAARASRSRATKVLQERTKSAPREEKRREDKKEENTKSEKKTARYSPDFEAWWKTYPARPGCPKGNKREAFAAWSKLDREHQLKAHAATKNLLASIASTNTLPKDAERFLRPPRGQGDPAYLAWVEVATPPPKLRLNDRGTDGGQDMLEKLNREAI